MSTQTTNLNMTDPATTDGVNTTINAIAEDITTIDTEFGLNGTTADRPTTGNYVGRQYLDTSINRMLEWNGSAWVDVDGVTAQPSASTTMSGTNGEVELTTTNATQILSITPTVQGCFSVKAYVRVTATTTITLKLTYTDGSGAQTVTWINAVSESAGEYDFSKFINATTTAAIQITATASTANQVYVSASIRPE